MNVILLVIVVVVFAFALFKVGAYRPMVCVDAWGEPDAGEACGWFCITVMTAVAVLIAGVLCAAFACAV